MRLAKKYFHLKSNAVYNSSAKKTGRKMSFNPFTPFNGPFNGEKYFSVNTFISCSEIQKSGPLNGAKDGLKSVTCKQTLKAFYSEIIGILYPDVRRYFLHCIIAMKIGHIKCAIFESPVHVANEKN